MFITATTEWVLMIGLRKMLYCKIDGGGGAGADLGFSRGGGAAFQKIFKNYFDDLFFLGRSD